MNLLGTVGVLLPIGVAGAISTIPLAAVSVILLSSRGRRNGVAYLIGWSAGTFLLTLALTYGIGFLPPSDPFHPSWIVAVGEVLIGILLVVYGIWFFRKRPAAPGKQRGWLDALDRAPTWVTLSAGLILSLRPKGLLLTVAAAVAISRAELDAGEMFIAIGIYTVITVSTVAGPVIFTLVSPERATRWLQRAKRFIAEHGKVLTLIVCLLIGAVLIGNGLTRF